jgi:hypothetical protein
VWPLNLKRYFEIGGCLLVHSRIDHYVFPFIKLDTKADTAEKCLISQPSGEFQLPIEQVTCVNQYSPRSLDLSHCHFYLLGVFRNENCMWYLQSRRIQAHYCWLCYNVLTRCEHYFILNISRILRIEKSTVYWLETINIGSSFTVEGRNSRKISATLPD